MQCTIESPPIRLALLALLVVACALSQLVSAQKVIATCERVEVDSDELTQSEADKYCKYAVSERRKVEKYWGATWTDTIRIQVSSAYTVAGALVTNQGKPGNITMPLARVKDMQGALLHEITHSYAPNSPNRFLQEGIAVYLQEQLSEHPAFPNFGRDLHVLAVPVASSVSSLESLNRVRYPTPLTVVMPERPAYLLAGSFVRFLIEKRGLPAFKTLYDTGSYEQAYQQSLEALERAWRSNLPTGQRVGGRRGR